MVKLLLLDKWLEAIDELIGIYSQGFSTADINCPLCPVHRQERCQSRNDGYDGSCYCPWEIFGNLTKLKKLRIGCYGIALRQSQEERIARLKDWRKRILRMKRRRK